MPSEGQKRQRPELFDKSSQYIDPGSGDLPFNYGHYYFMTSSARQNYLEIVLSTFDIVASYKRLPYLNAIALAN